MAFIFLPFTTVDYDGVCDASAEICLEISTKSSNMPPGKGATNEEEQCPLVMHDLWSNNDQEFLTDKLHILVGAASASEDECATAQKHIDSVKNMGCMQIKGCGHRFCAVPLLYTFMTSCFKCPVCRFGNKATIDISAKKPNNMPNAAWQCLCILSKLSSICVKKERIAIENMEIMEVAQDSLQDLYTMIPWKMVFSAYKKTDAKTGDIPFATVSTKMSWERGSINFVDTNVEFSSGTWNVRVVYVCSKEVFGEKEAPPAGPCRVVCCGSGNLMSTNMCNHICT
jgi:hypothetical protein